MGNSKRNKLGHVLIWAAGVLVYVVACTQGVGYFNPDEHYQILEFAANKLQAGKMERMPWELTEQIRSSFQPWLAYTVIKTGGILGINNPYVITLFLRSLTAAFAFVAIYWFYRRQKQVFGDSWQMLFLVLSLFIWFLPIVNVRFGSETWSGLFMLLVAGLIRSEGEDTAGALLLIGICCGLSFLCRFQSGIFVLSLVLWMVTVKKVNLRAMSQLLVGFVGVVMVGIVLDRLFYGEWTLTCWNYFNVNILKDEASNFGTLSWYSYVATLIHSMVLPIGILVFCGYIAFVALFPRSVYTWLTVPFIIIHLLIPHKEVRFLFPVVNFLPLILTLVVQQGVTQYRMALRSARITGGLLIAGNLFILAVAVMIPPSGGRLVITRFIDQKFAGAKIKLYHMEGEDDKPYEPYSFLNQQFYHNPRVKTVPFRSDNVEVATKDDTLRLFVVRGWLAPRIINIKGLALMKTGYPEWPSRMASFYFARFDTDAYFLFGADSTSARNAVFK
jgi:GPI mannosyltransferase 3